MSVHRSWCQERGGFVLALVVLMLFAISVAGAAGYLVANTEFKMAKYSGQGAEALTVARAGLHRFVAEQIGVVGDSVSYAIGNGVALVTSRKVAEEDSLNHIYYIRSEGTVTDIFAPGSPARRVVGAYAYHRKRPLAHHALVMISANTINVGNGGSIDAVDRDNAGTCAGGDAADITGAIAVVNVTEEDSNDIQGSPEFETWSGGYQEMLDSIGLRWEVLKDPNFPVEFENMVPNFGTLPADSFPIIRYTSAGHANLDGRGLLIIDGMFDPGPSFRWHGIVLAGQVDDIIQGHMDGLLIGGLDGPNPFPTIDFLIASHYHSCDVYAANETLSYLELIENTLFEAN